MEAFASFPPLVPGSYPPPGKRRVRRHDVDYAYAGGRLAALWGRSPDAARTARLAEVKDAADLARVLAEAGYPSAEDLETSLSEGMAAADRGLRELCREGDGDVLDLLLTAHDAHNLKLFLKDLSVFWPEPSLTVSEAGFGANDLTLGVRGQAIQIFAKIDHHLALHGTSKSRLLQVTAWLTDVGSFKEWAAAWNDWVDQGNPPVRATVGAPLANPSMLVEVMATAAL